MLATGVAKSAQDFLGSIQALLKPRRFFGAKLSLAPTCESTLRTSSHRRAFNMKVESMIGTSVPGLTAEESPGNPAEVPSVARGMPSTSPIRKDRFIVLAEDPALASRSLRAQVRPTLVFFIENPVGVFTLPLSACPATRSRLSVPAMRYHGVRCRILCHWSQLDLTHARLFRVSVSSSNRDWVFSFDTIFPSGTTFGSFRGRGLQGPSK